MSLMDRFLTELTIHHLRNISNAKLKLNTQCNLFYGVNGSGKTSLLEAIYLLGSGHSFRTREILPLVSYNQPSLTVFARTLSEESISIQKSLSGPTQVRLNRQACFRGSELAQFLPCQVFYQDLFQIIDAGPAVRRSLLDWGMFHVEHSYHNLWKNYRLVLRQRNALLRQKASPESFVPWDKQLIELSLDLDKMRAGYFEQWRDRFQFYLQQLTDVPCNISYYKGWDRKESGKDLASILRDQLNSDIQAQYTHSGPHQADILFDLSSKKAKLLLSRGQQKIALIALKLAQASLVPKSCLYLFDDVAAELDAQHLSRVIDCLATIKGQLFLTTLDDAMMNLLNGKIDFNFYSLKEGVAEG